MSSMTNLQALYIDEGSRFSSQGMTYHNAEGREVFPHLDRLSTEGACRYMEFKFIPAYSQKGMKVCCFEYDRTVNRTFRVEVIHPLPIEAEDDSGEDNCQRRYHCLSHIVFDLEQCYGTTVGCNDSYENLLPPLIEFSKKFYPNAKQTYN